MTTRRDGSSTTLHTSATFVNMSPHKEDASRRDTQEDALYEITKQLYSRLKKLRHRYRDLERKHTLLKAIHARVKQELLEAQQVDAGAPEATD